MSRPVVPAAESLPATGPVRLDEFGPCVAHWDGAWRAWRMDLALPLDPRLGDWLEMAGLYSSGNDFTSDWARDNPDYEGRSTLVRLWRRERPYDGSTDRTLLLWVLEHHGQPAGVVAWVRPAGGMEERWADAPTAHPRHRPKARLRVAQLGQAMVFLAREHRGQGHMRRVVQDHLAPALRRQARRARQAGAMPVVGAVDATAALLAQATTVPVAEHLRACQAFDADVWRLVTRARMYPERRMRQAPWLVEPEPMPTPSRRRARAAMA